MNYEPYYSEGWKNNEEGGTPITAASLNHVDDGLLDHDEDLQNIFGDMATMEESETASQSYAVGDYLILDGLLYKVTTAISSGGTIAPGTNCEQTTVSDEIKNRVLWFSGRSIASTSGSSGTLATITDARITANHVITKFVPANASVVTSGITCTTSDGAAVLTGTSTAATTAEIKLVKKDN